MTAFVTATNMVVLFSSPVSFTFESKAPFFVVTYFGFKEFNATAQAFR